jgi:hypothetical protein
MKDLLILWVPGKSLVVVPVREFGKTESQKNLGRGQDQVQDHRNGKTGSRWYIFDRRS